jgi:hypothetical protein
MPAALLFSKRHYVGNACRTAVVNVIAPKEQVRSASTPGQRPNSLDALTHKASRNS